MRILSLYIGVVLVLWSCTEEKEFPFNHRVPLPETRAFSGLDETGVTLHAAILSSGTEEIIHYGFQWESGDLLFEEALAGIPGSSYSMRITSDLDPQKEYRYRAFIRTSSKTYFGQDLSFTAQGALKPVILRYRPSTAMPGDSVEIITENLSHIPERNRVLILNAVQPRISQTDSSITFRVPEGFPYGVPVEIQVRAGNYMSEVNTDFRLTGPEITALSAETGFAGDILTITGSGFGAQPGETSVQIGTENAIVLYAADGEVKVIVPDLAPDVYQVRITYGERVNNELDAPSFEINQRWEPAGQIPDYASNTWFDFLGVSYFLDHANAEVKQFDPVTYETSSYMDLVTGPGGIVLSGDSKVYRIGQGTGGTYTPLVSEWDISTKQVIPMDLLPFNDPAVRGIVSGGEGYLFRENGEVWGFDMATGAVAQLAGLPVTGAVPFSFDGGLRAMHAETTYVYDAGSDAWSELENTNLSGVVIDRVIVFQGDIYAVSAGALYKYYAEYDIWYPHSTHGINSTDHYFYQDALHLVSGSGEIVYMVE